MAPAVTTSKYRRIAELGRGGMATVYLATTQGARGLPTVVVVKEMRPELAERDEFRRMFVEEARVAARLSHPNVVRTIEGLEDPPGTYCIVMEFLEGQPLSRLRAAARREVLLPLQLHIVSEVLAGLDYVHDARGPDGTPLNLIHRDVSPQNVFVTYHGRVKLLDFGIAKASDSSLQTNTGTLKGKLGYMAPEQVLGRPLDRRTDVFATGVVLWEALVGRRIWHGVPEAAILGRLMGGDLPRARSVKTDIPLELDAICARAMAADPADRYPTAGAFRAELDAFLATMVDPPSSRALGQLVGSLFADDRRKLREKIGAELGPGALQREPAPSVPADAAVAAPTPPARAPRAPRAGRSGTAFLLIGLAVAILIGVAVGATIAWMRARPRAGEQITPEPASRARAAAPSHAPSIGDRDQEGEGAARAEAAGAADESSSAAQPRRRSARHSPDTTAASTEPLDLGY